MPTVAPARPSLVLEWHNGRTERRLDDLAGEEPLEVRVAGRTVAVMMRTPGHDHELAAGLLLTENVIQQVGDIRAFTQAGAASPNVVELQLADGVEPDLAIFARQFSPSSACGLCGRASIEAVRRRAASCSATFRVTPQILSALPEALRALQPVFEHTGGLHAAALFDASGQVVVVREDIGRHNAVDKVIGWALLSGRTANTHGLLVSGRGGFEIVQKAVVAGLPLIACVSAPSSLAVQLARESGRTLIGFLRGPRFVVYAGEERIQLE